MADEGMLNLSCIIMVKEHFAMTKIFFWVRLMHFG